MRALVLTLCLLALGAGCALRPEWSKTLASPASALTQAEGVAYYIDKEGSLHAVDLASGEERWKYGSGSRFLDAKVAPRVSEGRVFVSFDKGKGLALDSQTGKVLWDAGGSQRTFLTPLPKGRVAAVQGPDLVLLDAATGRPQKRQHLESEGLSPPVYHQGMIYLIRKDNTPRPVEEFGLEGPPVRPPNVVCAYTAAELNLQWTNALASLRTVLTGGDKVLLVTAPTTEDEPLAPLQALDLKSGKRKWEVAEPPARAKHNRWAPPPPLSRGGKVFVNLSNGVDAYLTAVDEASGRVLWQSPNLGKEEGEASAATGPVMEGGTVAVGVGRQLLLFGAGSGERRSNFEADQDVVALMVWKEGLFAVGSTGTLYRFDL